jgi:hypothetical protein
MRKTDATSFLEQLILEKEALLKVRRIMLKGHFQEACESLKPANLITNGFKRMISSPEEKNEKLNSALGVTSGNPAKKTYLGNSNNPLVKLSGLVLEMVVTSKVSANQDDIKIISGIILKKLINKLRNPVKE